MSNLTFGSRSAVTGSTSATGSESVMVRGAAVALLADDIGLTLALTGVALAFGGATFVTVALLTVLERDSVSEESRGAQTASVAVRVVQALDALARDGIARSRIVDVDVARAVARFAEVAHHLRFTVEAWSAGLAQRPRVARPALAQDLSSVVGDVAFSGEVVGRDRQRAGADEAVGRRSAGGISVVTNFTLLAVITCRAVLAVDANARHRIAGIGVSWNIQRSIDFHFS